MTQIDCISSTHNPKRTFLDSTKYWRCILLKCFQASPLEWCIITLSIASCEWCHVMCLSIFSVMNNLCSLYVIRKYISFYVQQELSSCLFWVYNKHVHMFYTQSTLYFQCSITCRSLDTCQFSGILGRRASHKISLSSYSLQVKCFLSI